MIRKLLIGLVALVVVLAVAADRVGASVAGRVLASKLESDEHLSSKPSVSIGGFPFLNQAIAGKYGNIKVVARDVTTTDGVHIETLTAHLHGVHVPLSKVVGGSVSTVPVDHVDGTAFVSFAEITSYLTDHGVSLTLHRASDGTVIVAGHRLGHHSTLLHGVAKVSVASSAIVLTLTVGGSSVKPLVLPVPLRALPFRITVTSVIVDSDGITGAGTADHVVLGS